MDFSNTAFSLDRSIWSYGKIQRLVSAAIRGRAAFFRPLPAGPLLVDIGPGSYRTADFYNIDYAWMPGIDRCLDVTRGLRLPPNSADGAYCEHLLDQLPVDANRRILADLRNVLKEGAWLRIVICDLELYARTYVKNMDDGDNTMPMRNFPFHGVCTPAAALNIVMRDHDRKFVFDFNTYGRLLEEAGFRNVQKCAFGLGNDPRLLKDHDHRRSESMYIEAQK